MPDEPPVGPATELSDPPCEPPQAPAPEQIWIDELHSESLASLIARCKLIQVRTDADRTRHQLVLDLVKSYLLRGAEVLVDGVIEQGAQGAGYLRWPRYNFRSLPQDVYVPGNLERQYGLRNGNRLTARVRAPRGQERFLVAEKILSIEGILVDSWQATKEFDLLTALHPSERIVLENQKSESITGRALDIIAPLGRGQRGLIVAPPRTGKTLLLKDIAQSILINSPETHVILLLVDERPEEVTDFRRTVNCEIYSSTFDESPQRHTAIAELVSDRAKRLVEIKRHVVILMDSITRLSRAYNNLQGNRGRTMSGGVDSKALVKPKKFFSSARNTEEGGSLTVLATCLIETNSRMDDLIFEEYKGTGNMEIRLDRSLSDKRVFPAINFLQSATRRDELLYHPEEFDRISILRRQLAVLPTLEATEILVHALHATKNNAELLLTGLRG
ncbi:MAG: transcription termination factor Rho [Verrucomicrobiota bacterium]